LRNQFLDRRNICPDFPATMVARNWIISNNMSFNLFFSKTN